MSLPCCAEWERRKKKKKRKTLVSGKANRSKVCRNRCEWKCSWAPQLMKTFPKRKKPSGSLPEPCDLTSQCDKLVTACVTFAVYGYSSPQGKSRGWGRISHFLLSWWANLNLSNMFLQHRGAKQTTHTQDRLLFFRPVEKEKNNKYVYSSLFEFFLIKVLQTYKNYKRSPPHLEKSLQKIKINRYSSTNASFRKATVIQRCLGLIGEVT